MNNHTEVENVEVEVVELLEGQLADDATHADVIIAINALVVKINAIKVRDRGPQSTKSMTEELALTVLMDDDFKSLSHKKCAEKLGISYGQVSSVRGGYTFQKQYKVWRDAGSHKTWSRDYEG